MTNNEFEWLNEGHEFAEVSHHINRGKELNNKDFDDMIARSYGYKDDSDMNHRQYIRDKLCIIHHGNYCKRNK